MENLNESLGKPPTVPQYVLDQISLKEVSQEGFNLYLILGIGLAIIILLILIIYIYKKQKNNSKIDTNSFNLNNSNTSKDYSKNISLNSSFDESFFNGIKFLKSKDFKSARLEYYNMKNIAEKSGEKKLIDKTLDFYNKYKGALNEKK